MKLIGLMPVRNEEWVLGLSARVALQWCDELVIGFHSCTDHSESIAGRLDRVHAIEFRGEWDEMRHRDRLLARARAEGATHIAMIDADEVLTANLIAPMDETGKVKSIRYMVSTLEPGEMLEVPGYNLRGSLDRYHSNGIWGNRWFSLAFKDQPEAHWSGDKFHSREPAGVQWRRHRPIQQGEGGVMHLWGASERRLIAKHALYKVVERLRFPAKTVGEIDDLYSLAIKEPQAWRDRWTFESTPLDWWQYFGVDIQSLQLLHGFEASEPWQEAEVRRLVAEHGRERFAGLDLFGVA